MATCKKNHHLVITSKVLEAVRVGAVNLLTSEIDLQVEGKNELYLG